MEGTVISFDEIERRFQEVGLGHETKHRFRFGPKGLPISEVEKEQLEEIGDVAWDFVAQIDDWYLKAQASPAGSWMANVLASALPRKGGGYRDRENFWPGNRPWTFMVDTVWTSQGWKIVEIDVTNRNAMGYPLVMRHIYGLNGIWEGIDSYWQQWEGVTQIMPGRLRYYEPYFRFFLSKIKGRLVTEAELGQWMKECEKDEDKEVSLLDFPVMYYSREVMSRLFNILRYAENVAIPPKHYLSSKALTTLPWEMNRATDFEVAKFLPKGRLVCRTRPLPEGDFYLKMLQSSGAHGTFYNDRERLAALHSERKPKAIWQEALPICTRPVAYYDDNGQLTHGDFYVRVSLFVTRKGQVVDADATCSPDNIIHGSKRSVMTVPVLV